MDQRDWEIVPIWKDQTRSPTSSENKIVILKENKEQSNEAGGPSSHWNVPQSGWSRPNMSGEKGNPPTDQKPQNEMKQGHPDGNPIELAYSAVIEGKHETMQRRHRRQSRRWWRRRWKLRCCRRRQRTFIPHPHPSWWWNRPPIHCRLTQRKRFDSASKALGAQLYRRGLVAGHGRLIFTIDGVYATEPEPTSHPSPTRKTFWASVVKVNI